MNWLDITLLIICVFFVLVGFTRGLIRQVFSIAALVGGIIIGLIFYDIAGGVFLKDNLVQNESIANIGGFILIAFVSYVIIQVLGCLTTKLIGTLKLNWLNRLSGGVLGLVIGLIISFLFIFSLGLFYSKDDPDFKNSIFLPYLNTGYTFVRSSLPEDFENSLREAKELISKEGIKTAMKIKDSEQIKDIIKEQISDTDKPSETSSKPSEENNSK